MLSVIIPMYRSEGTIAEALDSVAAQQGIQTGRIEIVCVDDASPDSSSSVVDEWTRNARLAVRLIRMARNGGPATARNAGALSALGERLAFLDADDVWLPWKLAIQLQLADAHPDIALWCGNTLPLQGDAGIPVCDVPDSLPSWREVTLDDLAVVNSIATSSVLVTRAAFERAGRFDEGFRGPEDYDLWLRIAADNRIGRIDRPISAYRAVEGSLSLNDRTFLPEIRRVIEKAYGPGGVLQGDRRKGKAIAYQMLCASWSAAKRGARRRAVGLWFSSLYHWRGAFLPENPHRWPRLRLLWFFAKRFVDAA